MLYPSKHIDDLADKLYHHEYVTMTVVEYINQLLPFSEPVFNSNINYGSFNYCLLLLDTRSINRELDRFINVIIERLTEFLDLIFDIKSIVEIKLHILEFLLFNLDRVHTYISTEVRYSLETLFIDWFNDLLTILELTIPDLYVIEKLGILKLSDINAMDKLHLSILDIFDKTLTSSAIVDIIDFIHKVKEKLFGKVNTKVLLLDSFLDNQNEELLIFSEVMIIEDALTT